ncbi:MAG: SDR family NAD(P)-dependent oxidoreductase [Myxococcales bacterium]|nr:MAG: SDR family NAD(P)-dependent oxidoreductase [Myxococcales bacterium]
MAIYLITGASSGIGEQLARQAVARGHKVYGVARRKDKLDELARELGAAFLPLAADVADKASILDALGGLPELPDVAFCNAGVGDLERSTSFDVSLHERIFAVNYFGALNVVQGLFGPMAARGRGTFAATSSLAGYRGLPGAAAYTASKAAISTAFESLRLTCHKTGLRFVTVHPGFIATPMTQNNEFPMPFLWSAPKAAGRILDGVERGRLHINFPWPVHLAVTLGRLAPAWLYWRFMRR